MAEKLRSGLQNRLPRCNSGSRLNVMAKHKKKFLLPSQRAELLKAIEQGDIIERAEVRDKRVQPPAEKTLEPAVPVGEPTTRLETQGTETTARELRRIFATAVVLIVLLGCLTVIQIKTPYINDLATKLGTLLSI